MATQVFLLIAGISIALTIWLDRPPLRIPLDQATEVTSMRNYTARQYARIAFGVALVIGAIALVRTACFDGAAEYGLGEYGQGHAAARVLTWTWIIALGYGAIVYAIARWRRAERQGAELLRASLIAPAVGLALILPLTLHLLWFRFAGRDIADFDGWVGMSIVFTGLAHVAFAVMAARRASRLARGEKAMSPGMIYLLTIVFGMAPFPVFPSVLIALTGLPILPLLFLMKDIADRERAAIPPLPRAIARAA
jgi:hypothetical protein